MCRTCLPRWPVLGLLAMALAAACGCESNQYVRRDELDKALKVESNAAAMATLGRASQERAEWERRMVELVGVALDVPSISDALVTASLHRASQNRADLERRIDELAKIALTAPNINERTAALLASSQDAAGNLYQTLRAIDKAIDITATNLANANTTAYKRWRPVLGSGVERPTVTMDFGQGALDNTGRPLDVAIQGRGFFMVKRPSGEIGYTRDGHFFVDAQGRVVLGGPDGVPLEPPVTVPLDYTSIAIDPDGTFKVTTPGSAKPVTIGTIQLANFMNPESLAQVSGNLFLRSDDTGTPVVSNPGQEGAGTLVSQFLEKSNADMVQELIALRVLQNWHEGIAEALEKVLAMKAREIEVPSPAEVKKPTPAPQP